MKTIDLIAGARPNFMKIAPIIDALKAAQAQGKNVFVWKKFAWHAALFILAFIHLDFRSES
jgi:hypothetical protein